MVFYNSVWDQIDSWTDEVYGRISVRVVEAWTDLYFNGSSISATVKSIADEYAGSGYRQLVQQLENQKDFPATRLEIMAMVPQGGLTIVEARELCLENEVRIKYKKF